ncbi:MAG: hypothetical protein ACKOE6_08565, partial [Flammeovirgaceae bacterium]
MNTLKSVKPLCYPLLICAFHFSATAQSNDTTYLNIDLTTATNRVLHVRVTPPKLEKNIALFIIPTIIPGTYMKVNYKRFYKNFKAYSADGKLLPVQRKKNHVIIEQANQLVRLEYDVTPSANDQRVWDNILTCAGTSFNPGKMYLLNFQLITGYFEGHLNHPLVIYAKKMTQHYAHTSLTKKQSTTTDDTFFANDYHEFIDSPVLFAEPDTSSFLIDKSKFTVSVYSDNKKVSSSMLQPKIQKIMLALEKFMGPLPQEHYHFIFYYRDIGKAKDLFKTFGLGSALEHNQSSVYYYGESAATDTTFKYLNWICTHEYLHKIAPLSLGSEKIKNFNFDKPTMSQHLWLYEGVTDYFASQVAEQYELPLWGGYWSSLKNGISTANRLKSRSLTKSSRYI